MFGIYKLTNFLAKNWLSFEDIDFSWEIDNVFSRISYFHKDYGYLVSRNDLCDTRE